MFAAFLGLWASFSLGLLAIACHPVNPLAGPVSAYTAAGLDALSASRPDRARGEFVEALALDPVAREAALGLALSELLLLPASPAGVELLTEMGMQAPAMASEVFGPGGLLADLARGVERPVVERRFRRSLGLPEAGLDGVGAWLATLPETTTPRRLVRRGRFLAAELEPIATWLEAAAAPSDEPLAFVLPGGLFHLTADFVVGEPEALALAASLRAARAALLGLSEYDWSDEPLHLLARLEGEDLADALSGALVGASSAGSLLPVRVELERALQRMVAAIALGPRRPAPRAGQVVAWNLVPAAAAPQVADLLRAVAGALEGPTPLPDTDPPTALDLTFLGGPPPPPPLPLPAPRNGRLFQVGADGEPELSLRFVEAFTASAGVALPPLALDPHVVPTLFSSGVPEAGWLDRWLSPLVGRFEADLGF